MADPLEGDVSGSDNGHHRGLRMSMAGSVGVLLVGQTASTTEVEVDVDGGPPRGAVGGSDNVHHRG
jgi:hypothetical protein